VVKGLELKYAPEFRFALDETFDRMDETRRLFSDETCGATSTAA
jgi:ribosome-binding factor A